MSPGLAGIRVLIKTIGKVTTRHTPVIILALCTACGSGGSSGSDPASAANTNEPVITNGAISNDAQTNTASSGERELLVSDNTTTTKTITQCFCIVRFRSTLQFYHFEEKNAVLLIEFDNQTRDFERTAGIVLFDANASKDGVSKWINNQHSDGLYFDYAKPMATFPLGPDAISITSSAFVEKLTGDSDDEYEQTRIEFTVSNLSEPDSYFLNGFADQTVVYLQTR